MSDALSRVMESADSALVIVTTAAEDEPAGCVVGFHCQSSLQPERYAVWLSKANHTYRVGLRAEFLAVHFLRDSDRELARHFGTQSEDDVDKFADIGVEPGPRRGAARRRPPAPTHDAEVDDPRRRRRPRLRRW